MATEILDAAADADSGDRRAELRAEAAAAGNALQLVRQYALRAVDAWHLAVAAIVVPPLLGPGELRGFASRDEAQRRVAAELGFVPI